MKNELALRAMLKGFGFREADGGDEPYAMQEDDALVYGTNIGEDKIGAAIAVYAAGRLSLISEGEDGAQKVVDFNIVSITH